MHVGSRTHVLTHQELATTLTSQEEVIEGCPQSSQVHMSCGTGCKPHSDFRGIISRVSSAAGWNGPSRSSWLSFLVGGTFFSSVCGVYGRQGCQESSAQVKRSSCLLQLQTLPVLTKCPPWQMKDLVVRANFLPLNKAPQQNLLIHK